MILSHRWLGRHLQDMPDPDVVVRGLEQLGLEVVGQSVYGDIFDTVELVEVISRTPHPDADHLSLVDVRREDGEVTRIVTGANNGFPGQRLWYAPPGTTLPDGRTLEVRDLRGIASPGMLLSAEELGYQAESSGDLWVWSGDEALGTRFSSVIGGADTLYEVELTPNIAQYLQSVRKVAGELSAIWNIPLVPLTEAFAYQSAPLAVVEDRERCSLYGVVRMRLRPGGVSPLWVQTLLRAVGHRIIHPAVDVTNFVMWDLGEPLHAFDARRVDLPIVVRSARTGERLTLLDGTDIELEGKDLVIADQHKVLALAGIMGGKDSGVSDDTEEILLECAHFEAPGIFKSYKKHNLLTDAASHFGKGTDPLAVFQAPVLAASLLRETQVLSEVGDSALIGDVPPERLVAYDPARIRTLMGTKWDDAAINDALQKMGYQLVGPSAVVPRHRHDVESVYDLAEDVGRYFGLDSIPQKLPVQTAGLAERQPAESLDEVLRDAVAGAGYQEVITRTFTDPELDARFDTGAVGDAVAVTNPLRDEERIMRRYLLGSLMEVVRYNRSRHDLPIRIFEVGRVFSRAGEEVREERELAVVLSLDPLSGYPPREEPSIYDLTGLFDYVCERMGWDAERRIFVGDGPSFLHPGRSQALVLNGREAGYVGELRPRIGDLYRVRRVGVLVLRYPSLSIGEVSHPGRPSRFQTVDRDLSLVIPDTVAYGAINDAISELDIAELRHTAPVDRFEGDFGTSLTIRLTFQSDQRTLTDVDVDGAVSRILAALDALGVALRQ